jgi:hypothetical protein
LCLRFTETLWSKDRLIHIWRNNDVMLSFDTCELFVGWHLCFVLNFSSCNF